MKINGIKLSADQRKIVQRMQKEMQTSDCPGAAHRVEEICQGAKQMADNGQHHKKASRQPTSSRAFNHGARF